MRSSLLAAAVAFGLASCASSPPKPPPDLATMAIVVFYPITDVRTNPVPKMSDCNLTKPFGDKEPKFFFPINGKTQYAADLGYQIDVSASTVASMNAESLKSYRRGGEHYFVVTSITRWEYSGPSLEYQIESVLVRADDGTIVWKRSNKDSKWLGVIGGVFDALTEKVGPLSKCAFFFAEPFPNTFKQMPELQRY